MLLREGRPFPENALSRRAAIAAVSVALEKQRLADNCGDGGGLKRLGDQEGGLRTLAGEKPLRIGGDEDDRDLERAQQLVDGIEARAVVGQMDVGENEARYMGLGDRYRLAVGARDADHPMTKL